MRAGCEKRWNFSPGENFWLYTYIQYIKQVSGMRSSGYHNASTYVRMYECVYVCKTSGRVCYWWRVTYAAGYFLVNKYVGIAVLVHKEDWLFSGMLSVTDLSHVGKKYVSQEPRKNWCVYEHDANRWLEGGFLTRKFLRLMTNITSAS